MPVFAYRALTLVGRTDGGVIDAESAHAAWQALRARGVYPTELREQTAERAGAAAGVRRPPARELAIATRALATLVTAGLPLAEAVGVVAGETGHPGLRRALVTAGTRLREGESLAQALAASPRVFPPLYGALVGAAEASGALGPVLGRLAAHLEDRAATRARLRAVLTYPAVMTAATAAVLAFVVAWVVPQVTELYAATGAPLPLPTRVLVAVTDALRAVFWPALAATLLAAWAGRAHLARPETRALLERGLLATPVVGGLVRKAAVARFARTLATLVASGVPLEAGLGIAAEAAGNRAVAAAVGRARDAVREGEPLAGALAATGVFPPLLVRLTAVGERGGSLADALERAADAHEAEVGAAAATATALVEPALVLLMGGVVLALVAAVLLPLFELNALVR